MKRLTHAELGAMTRAELAALYRRIAAALPALAVGSPERASAYANLHAIRLRLTGPDFTPR